MNKFAKTLVAASVAAAALGSSVAVAEVSANISATSNYIWRGVSQTNDDAAIQGGVDYAHDSGFYAGTWTSTLGNGNGSELDFYLGFGGEVAGFGYDVGAATYMYPQLEDSDFTELYLNGSYGAFSAGVAYTVASDVDDVSGSAEAFIEGDVYYYVSAGFDLPQDFSVSATVGHYAFEDDGVASADLDYTNYQLALTKSAGDYGDFTLAYDDTDVDDDDATAYKEDAGLVSVSWTKTF